MVFREPETVIAPSFRVLREVERVVKCIRRIAAFDDGREIKNGKATPGVRKFTPALTAAQVPSMLRTGALASRDIAVAAHFQVGQRVRARNINPAGATRLPRYARGKLGSIEKDHGVYVFPDTNAHFLGEKPQHVYSVRFRARELWGEQASERDAVYIDLWDDYLEPA